MRHFELLKYMKDFDHGRSFEQNRILENQFSPIDQSKTTKENEDNTDHVLGKYSKLLHKGRLIHPNRVLWAVTSVAILTFGFYFYLQYGFGSTDLILAILPVACLVLFVWCASFLIPFCHCIYLDPHGIYITRYFMESKRTLDWSIGMRWMLLQKRKSPRWLLPVLQRIAGIGTMKNWEPLPTVWERFFFSALTDVHHRFSGGDTG